MTDVFSKEKRTAIMRAIPQTGTNPELIVRRMLRRMGVRFTLHPKDLPGTPDIVLRRDKVAIFVNGCFWHGHSGCSRAALPNSNVNFWMAKIAANKARDRAVKSKLTRSGWKYLVVWQCQLGHPTFIESAVRRILHKA